MKVVVGTYTDCPISITFLLPGLFCCSCFSLLHLLSFITRLCHRVCTSPNCYILCYIACVSFTVWAECHPPALQLMCGACSLSPNILSWCFVSIVVIVNSTLLFCHRYWNQEAVAVASTETETVRKNRATNVLSHVQKMIHYIVIHSSYYLSRLNIRGGTA